MKIYFAHPISDYGTTRGLDALITISKAYPTAEIINPDSSEHDKDYAREGMPYFKHLVEASDMVAFLRFPDGSIGAGVGQEIKWAFEANIMVVEIQGKELVVCRFVPTPILTVEETRAKLIDYGRKS